MRGKTQVKKGRWSEEKKRVISKVRFSDKFPSCHAKMWKAELTGHCQTVGYLVFTESQNHGMGQVGGACSGLA